MWWKLLNLYTFLLGIGCIVLGILVNIGGTTYRLSLVGFGLLWVVPTIWRLARSRWFSG